MIRVQDAAERVLECVKLNMADEKREMESLTGHFNIRNACSRESGIDGLSQV